MNSLLSLIEPSPTSSERRFHFFNGARYESHSKDDIRSQALRVAGLLLKNGLRNREPVILISGNSPFFAHAFFGILYAGGIPVPMVGPEYLERDFFRASLKHVASTCGARGLICEAELSDKLLPSGLQTWMTEKTELDESIETAAASDQSELALIQFSSGSTMAPKGVMLTHAALLANLQQIVTTMDVRSDEILSSWLPFYHDMGLIGGLLGVLYSNTVSYFSEPVDFIRSPRAWIEHVAQSKTSVIMGPNFLYKNLVRRVPENSVRELDLSRLRLALCGAEPVQSQICETFQRYYQPARLRANVVFPVYGLAENCLAVTFPELERTFVAQRFHADALAAGRAVPAHGDDGVTLVACGRPLAGLRLRIRHEGADCGPDQVGEIQIQSPSQALGYFANPEQTARLFDDGWVRTGDLGFLHDGLLFVSGRSKDLMIINGKNYFPSDVESHCYSRVGDVGRTAVFSNYDFQAQEERLFVVAESKAVWPWKKQRLAQRLNDAVYEFTKTTPSGVWIAPACSLPRTTSGKIRRYKLKEMQQEGQLATLSSWSGHWHARFAPLAISISVMLRAWRQQVRRRHQTRQIKRLTATFAQVMEIQQNQINLQKPLSHYKLDSLKVVLLNAKLKESGHDIPLGEFARFHRLQDVVDYIEARH